MCAGAKGHSDVSLCKVEDIIPKAGFTVVFHLGEVGVGTRTMSDKLLGIVEEVETEVKE